MGGEVAEFAVVRTAHAFGVRVAAVHDADLVGPVAVGVVVRFAWWHTWTWCSASGIPVARGAASGCSVAGRALTVAAIVAGPTTAPCWSDGVVSVTIGAVVVARAPRESHAQSCAQKERQNRRQAFWHHSGKGSTDPAGGERPNHSVGCRENSCMLSNVCWLPQPRAIHGHPLRHPLRQRPSDSRLVESTQHRSRAALKLSHRLGLARARRQAACESRDP